jgi:hypothetical protein
VVLKPVGAFIQHVLGFEKVKNQILGLMVWLQFLWELMLGFIFFFGHLPRNFFEGMPQTLYLLEHFGLQLRHIGQLLVQTRPYFIFKLHVLLGLRIVDLFLVGHELLVRFLDLCRYFGDCLRVVLDDVRKPLLQVVHAHEVTGLLASLVVDVGLYIVDVVLG